MKSRRETVIVAGSLQQARIAFRHVKFFMGEQLEKRSENGRKIFRVWDTMQGCAIENRLSGAILKCQGNDPRKAHGLAPSLVLADEPAQWDAKGEAMLSAMRTSAGKQAGFRMVCLGTRPAGPEHWFSRLLDGGADYIQIHAAAPGDPPFERETWLKANPGLDFLPDLEVAIQRDAEAAEARRRVSGGEDHACARAGTKPPPRCSGTSLSAPSKWSSGPLANSPSSTAQAH